MPAAPALVEPLSCEATTYAVGLDIGQARDHTAVCVVEQRVETETEWVPGPAHPFHPGEFLPPRQREKATVHAHVVFAARLMLATPYPDVVSDVAALLEQLPPTWGSDPTTLWIDASGVGRGLLDMFADRAASRRGVSR